MTTNAPRRRLARRYVVVAVALAAGSVLATGAVNLRFTYLAEREALAGLQGEQAAAAASRIAAFIDEIDRQLASATAVRTGEERHDVFRRILFQVPAVRDLRWIDEDGIERVIVSRVETDVLDGDENRSTEDAFTAPARGRHYYGPVRFRDDTEPYLLVAHRGEDGGAVVADIHLALIRDVVAGIKVGERGEAFAVDNEGVLVAHPDLTLVLGRRDLSALPHIRRASSSPGVDGLTSRDLNGARVLASFRVIDRLGWAVIVQQPLDVAFDRVEGGIVRTTALLLVAVLLAGTAALVLGRRMVRPLAALQEGAARISGGALGHRIDVRSGDELEALADEFNLMGDRLQTSLDELRRSRARVVAAGDDARRRLERDLHDGAQQHLVAVAIKLRLARRAIEDTSPAAPLLDELHDDVQRAVADVRTLAHGLYPPLLASGGLQVALPTAAKMAALQTTVDVDGTARYPLDIEATVYFCCLEALQNAAKHAGEATTVQIRIRDDGAELHFSVSDDGAGFDVSAREAGQGLLNMADRVGALGGTLDVRSTLGQGTTISGTIPLPA